MDLKLSVNDKLAKKYFWFFFAPPRSLQDDEWTNTFHRVTTLDCCILLILTHLGHAIIHKGHFPHKKRTVTRRQHLGCEYTMTI